MNTPKNPRPPLLRRRAVRVIAVAAAVLFVAAAFVFEPWNLVIDRHVDEAMPAAAPAAAAPAPAAAEPAVLGRGTLISHEHESSGSVVLVALADGSRVLRVENLQTSNGPDLHVWLTDAPVIEGTAGWSVFDDGRYIDLGELKGNIGSSNYAIPADADLTGLSSVSVWCARFRVSFAAAPLNA